MVDQHLYFINLLQKIKDSLLLEVRNKKDGD